MTLSALPQEVRDAVLDFRLECILSGDFADRIDFRWITPSYPGDTLAQTACWQFDEDHRCHRVGLGSEILSNKNLKPALGNSRLAEYHTKYLLHELYGHGHYSVRQQAALDALLKKHQVEFRDYNLFADAYIEHRVRQHYHQNFSWTEFETLQPPDNAWQFFFNLIQAEGDLNLALSGTSLDCTDEVFGYYQEAVQCPNESEVFPVINRFASRFGQSSNQVTGSRTHVIGSGDLSTHMSHIKEALDRGIQIHSEQSNSNDPAARICAWPNFGLKIDYEQAAQIANLLIPKDSRQRRWTPSPSPSKRLNLKAELTDSPNFYLKKNAGNGSVSQPVKVAFLVDCSGSMKSVKDDCMTLMAAFNVLAQRQKITGLMVYCGEVAGGGFDRYPLPVTRQILGLYSPKHNGEDFCTPTRRLKDELLQCQAVFYLTDAEFQSPRPDTGYLHAAHIPVAGVYVGPDARTSATALEIQTSMRDHFNHIVVKPNIVEAAYTLGETIKAMCFRRGTASSPVATHHHPQRSIVR